MTGRAPMFFQAAISSSPMPPSGPMIRQMLRLSGCSMRARESGTAFSSSQGTSLRASRGREAAACAALGLLLSLRKSASPVSPAVLCAAGSLLSLLALLYCRAMLPERNAVFLAAAAALTVSAALLSELLFRRGRAAS